jgi:hypothetical protein
MMTPFRPRLFRALPLLLAFAWCPLAAPAATLDGKKVSSGIQRLTLADTGLPAQIEIAAAAAELPQAARAQKTHAAAALAAIGRGPQLRAPIRLEVTAGGQTATATASAPAALTAGDTVTGSAKLTAADVAVDLNFSIETGYTARLRYSGGEVDSIALVLEFAGSSDTVITGSVSGKTPAATPAAAFAVPTGKGLVWANAGEAVGATRAAAGVPTFAFVGSGDRGFSVSVPDAKGWHIDPAKPSLTIERDDQGLATWRIYLVNKPTTLAAGAAAAFTLTTHPVAPRPADARRAAWLAWDALATAAGDGGVLRADAVTPEGGTAKAAQLVGPAGGDAVSAAVPLSDTYPINLFRYLAGTHTGTVTRVVSNAHQINRAGSHRGPDRMVLGRALLHDIGADARRLAHQLDAATLVKGLHAFGYFADDGKTEYLPYWRSADVVRFGETHGEDDAFAAAAEDPLARVHVSAWIRPDAGAYQAMILIVNEGAQPVREQLYVTAPKRLFGGANRFDAVKHLATLDFSKIPPDADWRLRALQGTTRAGQKTKGPVVVLRDLEDNGWAVRRAVARDGGEVYGMIHIPARSYRLFYGSGVKR